MTRKPTIYEALATRLGREPTHSEQCEEVKRILRNEPINKKEGAQGND